MPTSDYTVNAEQRVGAKADSVGLYIKQIGNKLLSSLMPSVGGRIVTPADFVGFDI